MSEQPIHIDTINGDFCLNKYVYNADSRAADETEVEVVSTQPNETRRDFTSCTQRLTMMKPGVFTMP